MKRSLDGLAGHPKWIANHLPGKALTLLVTIPFVLPLLSVAALLLTIPVVMLMMSATGEDERNEQGQNYRM